MAAAGAMLAWARRLQAGDPSDSATLHLVEVALGAQGQRHTVLIAMQTRQAMDVECFACSVMILLSLLPLRQVKGSLADH